MTDGEAAAEVARLREVIRRAWALTIPRGDEVLSGTYAERLARIREITAAEFYRDRRPAEPNTPN